MVKSRIVLGTLISALFIVFICLAPVFAFGFDDILAFFGMKSATGYATASDAGGVCECSDCVSCSQMLWGSNNCKVIVLKNDIFMNGTGACCVKPPQIVVAGANNQIDGKTLDCKGNAIRGILGSETGINVKNAKNIAIKNCKLDSMQGLIFENVANSEVSNTHIVVKEKGLEITHSNNISLKNITLVNDKKAINITKGLIIANSNNVNLLGSDVSGLGEAIKMTNASNTIIKNSKIHEVSLGISAQGSKNSTIENNTFYSLTSGGLQQIHPCTGVYIANSENFSIKGNTFANTSCVSSGNVKQPTIILIELSNRNIIFNNTITNNKGVSSNMNSTGNAVISYDIILSNSSQNLLQNNDIYLNGAVCVGNSSDSCCNAFKYGISIDKSSNNTLIGNDVENNTAYQVCGNKTTLGASFGLSLVSSDFNIIKENVLIGHTYDLFVEKTSKGNAGEGNAGNSASGWSEGGNAGFSYTGAQASLVKKLGLENITKEQPPKANISLSCSTSNGADKRMDYDNDGVVDGSDVDLLANATKNDSLQAIICSEGKVCDLNKDGNINEDDANLKLKDYINNNCKFRIEREVEDDELSMKYLLEDIDNSTDLFVYDVFKDANKVSIRKGYALKQLDHVISPPLTTSIIDFVVGGPISYLRGANAKIYGVSTDAAYCSHYDDCVYNGKCYNKNETLTIQIENGTANILCDSLVVASTSTTTGVCTCDSCADCTTKLNDASCTTVKLTANITDFAEICINWPTNDKIFDCQGNTIDGDDGGTDYGIYLNGKSGNTIKNCIVTGFFNGIYLDSSSNNILTNNTANTNTHGIALSSSSNNILNSNKLCSNTWGDIYIYGGSGNSGDNNKCDKASGYNDDGCTGCTYLCNGSSNPTCPVDCTCTSCDDCEAKLNDPLCTEVKLTTNITDYAGTCITNPANFSNKIFDCQGNTIDGDGSMTNDYRPYGIDLTGKSGNTIKNCVFRDFFSGIYLKSSSNNTLTNNTVISTWYGIRLESSSTNNIINNNASLNGEGIYLSYSSNNNTLTNNTANLNIGTYGYGIWLWDSYNNILTNNKACKNSFSDISCLIGGGGGCEGSGNIGVDNECNTTGNNWGKTYSLNDTGTTGCTYSCTITPAPATCECNSCADCTNKLTDASCTTILLSKDIVSESKESDNIDNDFGICISNFNNKNQINNKIFDCQGHTISSITSGWGQGISFTRGDSNNTIKNCIITGFVFGIDFSDTWLGSGESQLNNNVIEGCTIINNKRGIEFWTGSSSSKAHNGKNNVLNNNYICNYDYDLYTNYENTTGKNNTCNNIYKSSTNLDYEGSDQGSISCDRECGVCTCNSCDTCNQALNDSTKCGRLVKLTANITNPIGTCIDDPANFSNKIFDCQGYTIDGAGFNYGIYLYNKDNNTIKNCVITNVYYGIYLSSSSNNTLTNNTANSNSYGINLYSSSNNILTNNTANSNGYNGIRLHSSSNNNTLTNNTANSNKVGIYLYSSSNNNITNNTVTPNTYGIVIDYSSNNILTNNTANSNTYGIYLYSSSNYNILNTNKVCNNSNTDIYTDGTSNTGTNNTCNTTSGYNDGGTTGCTWNCAGKCNNCSLCNTTCGGDSSLKCDATTGNCVQLYKILDGGICECDSCNSCNQALNDNTHCGKLVKLTANITNTIGTCIDDPANFSNKIFDCQGNTIDGDDSGTSSNLFSGIYLNGKTNNTIKNCVFRDFFSGIYLRSSKNNTLINNTANWNGNGIYLVSSSNNNNLTSNTANSNIDYGIYLSSSPNNTITNNTLNLNIRGIYLEQSSNNNLTNNTANLNNYGIYLLSSLNNILNTNKICNNSNTDIYSTTTGNTGDNNKCDKTSGYNDTGTTGCTWNCAGKCNNCSLCNTTCGGDSSLKCDATTGNCVQLYKILDGGICECDSCNSCNQALNDNTHCGNLVRLTANITNQAGNCIYDPANFNNKIFDCQGYTIDGDDIGSDYGIYLSGKTGNTIKNCIVTDFYFGILLYSSSNNNNLTSNTANSNVYGIYLWDSSNNSLTNNTANSNKNGIELFSSSNNILINNTASPNTNYGIYLYFSSNNTLTNNTANTNTIGIYLYTFSNNNALNTNKVCNNSNTDIYSVGIDNTGTNNTCNKSGYNDTGTTGCTWNCAGKCNNCSLCNTTCGGDSSLKCDAATGECVVACVDKDGDGYGVCPNCNISNGCTYNRHDCNDTNSSINPGATETCNNKDDNCNKETDEGVTTPYYEDNDKDTYGNPSKVLNACAQPSGYVTNNKDCDDSNKDIKPGATEICDGVDNNCNKETDEGNVCNVYFYCDSDKDGQNAASSTAHCTDYVCYNKYIATCPSIAGTDCNDTNSSIFKGAKEICNGVDDNCDGKIDEGVKTTFYKDNDNDNYGNPTDTTQACTKPTGYVTDNTDCNDNDATINPKATEVCNGVDDNCNGKIDNQETKVCSDLIYYCDKDNDGYISSAESGKCDTYGCTPPKGCSLTQGTDCDDNNNKTNPKATEVCNGVDDNCDGKIDEGVKTTFYKDNDNDNYGNPTDTTQACTKPTGYVTDNTDCNDNDATINPGAKEICNGQDDNCNKETDEGVTTPYYEDNDKDTYGNPSKVLNACAQPSGYVTNNKDCNDANATINPGATEIYNKVDDNCNDQIDEGFCDNSNDCPQPICGSGPGRPLCGDGAGTFCNATHQCQAKKTNDQACSANEQCRSDNCYSNVCRPLGYNCEPANSSINTTHYCDANHHSQNKKNNDATCSQNYECSNSNCLSGKCHPADWTCVNKSSSINTTHYCDANHHSQNKKNNDATCSQNYECTTNNCLSGKCHPADWTCVNKSSNINTTHFCNSTNQINTKKTDNNSCSTNYECQNSNCINSSLADRCFEESGESYKQKCAPSAWECPCADSPMSNEARTENGTHYCNPNHKIITANLGLNVLKTADKQRADLGENITYTIFVNNTGNVPLKNITLVDDLLNWSANISRLNASESKTYTLNYTLKLDDLAGTKYKNTDKKVKDIFEDQINKIAGKANNDKAKQEIMSLKNKNSENIDSQPNPPISAINKLINVVVATGQFNPIISASGGYVLDANAPNTTLVKIVTYPAEPANVGDNISYNITLKNTGSATDVLKISDAYDSKLNITNISSTCGGLVGGCNIATNKCEWNLSLPASTSCSIIVKTQVLFIENNTQSIITKTANATSTYTNETSALSKTSLNISYVFYRDADGDKYGNKNVNITQINNATIPSGYVRDNTDCGDGDPNVNPGIVEDGKGGCPSSICGGNIDNDCDGQVDEGCNCGGPAPKYTCYKDADNDTYGNTTSSITQSSAICPTNYTDKSGDCNDSNKNINPNAIELCDGIDNNCINGTDEGCICITGNTQTCTNAANKGICKNGIQTCVEGIWGVCVINTPTKEICNNGKDDDCDGFIDGLDSDCSTSCTKTKYEICTYKKINDTDPKCTSSTTSGSFVVCVATLVNANEIAEKAAGKIVLFSVKAEESSTLGLWYRIVGNDNWVSLDLSEKFVAESVDVYEIKLNRSCGGNNYCKIGDTGECGVNFTIVAISCICGDGVCGINENCSKDCEPKKPVCGNKVCETGENNTNCPGDCEPGEIGNGAVGGGGGTISASELQKILEQQKAFLCGNGICDSGIEDCSSCPNDCGDCKGAHCGNGICDYITGESCKNCIFDCGFCKLDEKYCGDGICDENEKSFCAADCPDVKKNGTTVTECKECNYLTITCIPNTLAWLLLLIFTVLSTFFAYLLMKKKANFIFPVSVEDIKADPKQAITSLFEKENLPFVVALLAVLIIPLIFAIIMGACLPSQIMTILALLLGVILGAMFLMEKMKEEGGAKEYINNRIAAIKSKFQKTKPKETATKESTSFGEKIKGFVNSIKDKITNLTAKITKKGGEDSNSNDKNSNVSSQTTMLKNAASAFAAKGIQVKQYDLVASQFAYQGKQFVRVLTKDKKHEAIFDMNGKVLRVI